MSGEPPAAATRIIEIRESEDVAPAEAQGKADVGGSTGSTAAAPVKVSGPDEAAQPLPPPQPVLKAPAAPVATPVTAAPVAAASSTVGAKQVPKPASKASDGLSDEALTQIAQAKFEAQEEKLRDVARQSMALLRDYRTLRGPDCERRVAEIRKSLLKYEMQYIRAWASQERRRRLETEALEAEAARCRQQAQEEGSKIAELRQALEQERQRRKRYERYEQLAEEVSRKKSRVESQAEIDAASAEIERLRARRAELEALTEQRNHRAQLLRHAVAELKQDLQQEQQLKGDILDGRGTVAATNAPNASGKVTPAPAADVEVVS